MRCGLYPNLPPGGSTKQVFTYAGKIPYKHTRCGRKLIFTMSYTLVLLPRVHEMAWENKFLRGDVHGCYFQNTYKGAEITFWRAWFCYSQNDYQIAAESKFLWWHTPNMATIWQQRIYIYDIETQVLLIKYAVDGSRMLIFMMLYSLQFIPYAHRTAAEKKLWRTHRCCFLNVHEMQRTNFHEMHSWVIANNHTLWQQRKNYNEIPGCVMVLMQMSHLQK